MRGWRSAAMAAALFTTWTAAAPAQTWRTVTSARQIQGERALDVHIQYAAGRFSVAPGPRGTLYRMELRYDEDRFIPVRRYDARSGRLELGVRGRDGTRVRFSDRNRNDEPPTLAVELPPDLPLRLDMELGAAESDVELGGLSILAVRYRTGASETRLRFSTPNRVACDELVLEAGAAHLDALQLANANCERVVFDGGVGGVTLDFTGTWQRDLRADIDVGIGSLTLRLPQDVGVSIRLSRFLASFDRAGFTKRGDTWYSGNWNRARHHLTMDVNAAIGGVDVTWVGR